MQVITSHKPPITQPFPLDQNIFLPLTVLCLKKLSSRINRLSSLLYKWSEVSHQFCTMWSIYSGLFNKTASRAYAGGAMYKASHQVHHSYQYLLPEKTTSGVKLRARGISITNL